MARPLAHFEEQDMAWADARGHLRGGIRVRVRSAVCQFCGEDILAREVEQEDGSLAPLGTFTVAVAMLRELATLPHHDDCPGPTQWETEPADPREGEAQA